MYTTHLINSETVTINDTNHHTPYKQECRSIVSVPGLCIPTFTVSILVIKKAKSQQDWQPMNPPFGDWEYRLGEKHGVAQLLLLWERCWVQRTSKHLRG